MKYILIFFLLLSNDLSAQTILISLLGNDCIKCKFQLETNIIALKHIPQYYIFNEKYKKDSLQIQKKFSINSKDIVFSDFLMNQKKIPASSITYIDKNGNSKFEKNLLDFNTMDVDSINKWYSSDSLWSNAINDVNIENGWRVTKNDLIKNIEADSGGYSISAIMNDSISNNAIKLIEKYYPNIFSYNNKLYEKYGKSMFDAQIVHQYFSKGMLYSIIKVPYSIPPTIEDINNGALDGSISNKLVLLITDKSNSHQFFLFDNDKNYERFTIFYNTLSYNDNKFFICVNSNSDIFKNQFIAEFIISDDKIYLHKMLNNKNDENVTERTKKLGIAPNNNTLNFPYYILPVSLKISNLAIEKDYYYKPNFDVNFNVIDDNFARKLIRNEIQAPIMNYKLMHNKELLYLISNANNTTYISLFKIINQEPRYLYSKNIKQITINNQGIEKYTFDVQKSLIQYSDKSGIYRTMILELLIN